MCYRLTMATFLFTFASVFCTLSACNGLGNSLLQQFNSTVPNTSIGLRNGEEHTAVTLTSHISTTLIAAARVQTTKDAGFSTFSPTSVPSVQGSVTTTHWPGRPVALLGGEATQAPTTKFPLTTGLPTTKQDATFVVPASVASALAASSVKTETSQRPTTKAPLTTQPPPTTTKRGRPIALIAQTETQPPMTISTSAPTTVTAPSTAKPQFIEDGDTVSKVLEIAYDCRRESEMCYGTCDITNGACICDRGRSGLDCALEESTLVENSLMCNNGRGCGSQRGAKCVRSEGSQSYVCSCPYSWYGDACEKPCAQLRCSSTFLAVIVSKYSIGKIYVIESINQTTMSDLACAFSVANDVTSLRLTYSDLVEKCGGLALGNATYEISFVVQSNPDWLTYYDQMISARCTVNVTREYDKIVFVEAGNVPASVSRDLTNVLTSHITAERKLVQTVSLAPTPVLTVSRESKTGDVIPLSGSVKIGDTLAVMIENVNDTFFSAIRPEYCVLKMDETVSVVLIRDRCPASKFAWSLVQWSKTKATNTTVTLFVYLPGAALATRPHQITFGCRVKLCALDLARECELDVAGCAKKLANNEPTIRGRRSAENERQSTSYVYVAQTLKVVYEPTADAASTGHNLVHASLFSLITLAIVINLAGSTK